MAIRHAAAVTAAASLLTLVPAAAAGAHPQSRHFSSFDRRLIFDINSARAQHGLPALTVNNSLESLAVNWARREAASRHVSNDPKLRSEIAAACPDWQAAGQVVGVAGETTADGLFQSYMRNSAEREQLLAHGYSQIGSWSVATNQNGALVRYNSIDLATGC